MFPLISSGKVLYKVDVNSSLNACYSLCGAGDSNYGSFKLKNSCYLIVTGLLISSISYWVSFGIF